MAIHTLRAVAIPLGGNCCGVYTYIIGQSKRPPNDIRKARLLIA